MTDSLFKQTCFVELIKRKTCVIFLKVLNYNVHARAGVFQQINTAEISHGIRHVETLTKSERLDTFTKQRGYR